jgi:hypothetical protein
LFEFLPFLIIFFYIEHQYRNWSRITLHAANALPKWCGFCSITILSVRSSAHKVYWRVQLQYTQKHFKGENLLNFLCTWPFSSKKLSYKKLVQSLYRAGSGLGPKSPGPTTLLINKENVWYSIICKRCHSCFMPR